MFDPREAVTAGFLDAVVAPDELMPAALAMAEHMKKLTMTAHANTKVKARRAFLETLDWAIEEDKRHPL
jgi:enoyl-CoA hydratase